MNSGRFSPRQGTALFDLVVVVGIIGLLIAMVIPMLVTARDRSERFNCAKNLREIGFALERYADDHGGRLPATRPASEPDAPPDCTNSGADALDPFKPGGPAPNNVPAALFLLVRTGQLSPDLLICPGTDDVPDPLASVHPLRRSNFADLDANLSYSIQNPYAGEEAIASGFRWTRKLPASFPLVADRNPGQAAPGNLPALSPNSPRDRLRSQNSRNHRRKGQNVLYADGRVEFRETCFAGVGNDHIYISRRGLVMDAPRDRGDAVLLPADNPRRHGPEDKASGGTDSSGN